MRISVFAAVVALAVGCAARAAAPLVAHDPPPPAPTEAKEMRVAPAPAVAEPPKPEGPIGPPRPTGPELPRGGRTIFPNYRLVGYCGTPGAPALGKLMNKLPQRAKEIEELGKKYAGKRESLPVFELIAVVVQSDPGPDKKSRRRVPDSVVDDYLREARATKGLLLINIQPGHAAFMDEVRYYERYLKEPDVGIAMDPEWSMKPKQKPGVFYGQTTGDIITEVGAYLSDIVKTNDLPEKALVFHQMNGYVVKDEDKIQPSPGVAIIKSVDGLGPMHTKIVTYNYLSKKLAPHVHAGFKLFFDEDTANGQHLMTPAEVLKLTPEPEYVLYE